jgi:Ca-activated chloride channel homolog
MRFKQHAGPIVFILLLIACVVGAGAVLAVEPKQPSPSPMPVVQGSGSAQIPARHYVTPRGRANIIQDLPEQQSDGSLQIANKDGEALFCPLKHTDVNAEVSGFLARVKVTQEFTNTSSDKVEAIYTFPLPQNAAVDDMTMRVGERTIKGLIKRREEAQKIYQQAIQAGHTAALLDQERPNIFTQSVGNIPPGASVKVEISYIEVLKYDAGAYEFVYPMVVGPRYIPGNPNSQQAGGWSPDTDQVPDASRITPPVAGVHYGKKGTRAGHDISLAVKLDAGVIIKDLQSPTHEIDKQLPSARTAAVKLRNEKEIPNRDFVLRYEVAGDKIEDALLTTASFNEKNSAAASTEGYFTFILQPPDRVKDEDASPRELTFVLDTSGSMSGFPIETAKSVMKRAIEHMRPQDTFNLVTFAGDTHVLFPQPMSSSAANIAQATAFLSGQRGGGGTEMMKAIRVALGDDGSGIAECTPNNDCALVDRRVPTAGDPIRIVCFMTDGYVGNDMEIISAIQKHPEARVFSFGIGSSVNRFLLDKMAEAGRGEVEYVLNDKQAPEAADRFYERVHTPVLTDVSIDWHGLPVTDVYPQKLLDLFTAKPLTLTGRYAQPASGSITLRGKRAGKPFERTINVELPQTNNSNQALAQLWARTKIDELMSQDWRGMQSGEARKEIKEQITQLGLDYRLMTQFTSFVAVEEQTVVEGGRTRTIQVPVEMPQGVSAEGVFGRSRDEAQVLAQRSAGFSPSFAKNGTVSETVEVTASAVTVDPTSSSTTYTQSLSEPPYNAPYYPGEPRRAKSQPKTSSPLPELKDEALAGKLHSDLLAVAKCAKQGSKCDHVSGGKVHVEVWLERSLTRTELEQLFAAGLTPDQNKNTLFAAKLTSLRGTIAVEKIGVLAALPGVRLISLAR